MRSIFFVLTFLLFVFTSSGQKTYDEMKTIIPSAMLGEWYNVQNGDLIVGFYSNYVVLHEKVWKYKTCKKQGNKYLLNIVNNKDSSLQLTFRIKSKRNYIEEVGSRRINCSQQLSDCHIEHQYPNFQNPIFENGSFTLSGFIENYNGQGEDFNVVADVLLQDRQKYFSGKIQANGYFSIKLSLFNPTVLIVMISGHYFFPYVVPNQDLFVMIKNNKVVFGGKGALLASEDQYLRDSYKIYMENPLDIRSQWTNLSPDQYKQFWFFKKAKAEKSLDSIYAKHLISPATYQMHQLDIKYATYTYLLDYNLYQWRANPQQYEKVSLPKNYFDFLHGLDDGEFGGLTQAFPNYVKVINNEIANDILFPFFNDKGVKDSLEKILGKIETVAEVYHNLRIKWAHIGHEQANLLESIYEQKDTYKRQQIIENNQVQVNQLLSKYNDLAFTYVFTKMATKFMCDSSGWKRGASTDLFIPSNIAMKAMKEQGSFTDDFFDTRDSIFSNTNIAKYVKDLFNEYKNQEPTSMSKTPDFVVNWSNIGESGVISRDTIRQKGYTLILVSKYQSFPDSLKKKFIEVFFKVYPRQVELYNPNAARHVTFVIDPEYTGIAASADSLTRFNPKWFEVNPTDYDVVTHETMHIVQDYRKNHYQPIWVTEGIADYVRFSLGVYNKEAKWALPEYKRTQSYKDSYRVTARFFYWLQKNIKNSLIKDLDQSMRSATFTEEFWKNETGKTIDQLWTEYSRYPSIN